MSCSKHIINKVNSEIDNQLINLPRQEITAQALKNSRAILFKDIEDCVEFSNMYAPEHLILAVETPNLISNDIISAGSVFLGNWSCESVGDYASGTNHTLPTAGYAKSYSGVSLESFQKKISFQQLSQEGIIGIGNVVETMAEAEQLYAHKNAVTIRLKKLKNNNTPV